MSDEIKTTSRAAPVPYRVYARVGTPWEGKPAVVINEGGDMQVGYSIWSREEADRVISEMMAARDAAWPT